MFSTSLNHSNEHLLKTRRSFGVNFKPLLSQLIRRQLIVELNWISSFLPIILRLSCLATIRRKLSLTIILNIVMFNDYTKIVKIGDFNTIVLLTDYEKIVIVTWILTWITTFMTKSWLAIITRLPTIIRFSIFFFGLRHQFEIYSLKLTSHE